MTTPIKPTINELKSALSNRVIILSPSKRQWLRENAPAEFDYIHRVLLGYVQGKLASNPDCKWWNIARGRFRISAEDCDVVNIYLTGRPL